MQRDVLADMVAFMTVAELGSFTKAASKLGLSQSALSQIVKRLETHLGMRLLARTTRSVAPTLAGERLLSSLVPTINELEQQLANIAEMRDKPAGSIRINAVEHATSTILTPALAKLLPDYPDIKVEIVADYGLADIVSDRFDAGVRLGHQVAKDMIAVRIGPDIPMAIVGSPSYFSRHSKPLSIDELVDHQAINLYLPTSGAAYRWNLLSEGKPATIEMTGQIAFNSLSLIIDACIRGLGLAILPIDCVDQHIKSGKVEHFLQDATIPLPGYHLYYPHRRKSAAFALLIDTIRYRE